MLLKDLINEGTRTISSLYPEREAREMVFAYLESAVGTSRHTHIIEPSFTLSDDSVSAAHSAFARMAAGEPLQYVVGKAYFYGREFRVSPDVLIPRPETEILCREVCDFLAARRTAASCYQVSAGGGPSLDMAPEILDLCTGSGCIAWTLALENPGASVTAVDISDGALTVASGQDFSDEISRTGASAPHFIKADVLAGPSESAVLGCPAFDGHEAGSFDVLVSNPPYVMDSEKALMRSNVLDHEPHLALFVPDSDPLLFYRAIASWASELLRPGGFAIVEINEALGSQTAGLYRTAGFRDVRILKDLNDKDRFVTFRHPDPKAGLLLVPELLTSL